MPKALIQRLSEITQVELVSTCRRIPPSYPSRQGRGKVQAQLTGDNQITLFEKGFWKNSTAFTSVYRWTASSGQITLEHLRLGVKNPVHLFALTPLEDGLYKSLTPHICDDDIYTGTLLMDTHYLHLDFRVFGPKKNEAYRLVYS